MYLYQATLPKGVKCLLLIFHTLFPQNHLKVSTMHDYGLI